MNFFFEQDFLFDSHAHLTSSHHQIDVEQVVALARSVGVERIVDVGVDLETSKNAIAHSKSHPETVKAAVGIDPQILIPTDDYYEPQYLDSQFRIQKLAELDKLIEQNRDQVAAIGETGMDNYYNSISVKSTEISQSEADKSLAAQESLFRGHLELAGKFNLPITIHSRAIEDQCARVVSDYPNVRGVFHSFTGSYDTAKKVLDLGWGLGVNGIITFKNAAELRTLYAKILGKVSPDWSPGDFYAKGIYFETDAPYLAPGSRRGEQNQSAYLAEIYEYMVRDFANQTS